MYLPGPAWVLLSKRSTPFLSRSTRSPNAKDLHFLSIQSGEDKYQRRINSLRNPKSKLVVREVLCLALPNQSTAAFCTCTSIDQTPNGAYAFTTPIGEGSDINYMNIISCLVAMLFASCLDGRLSDLTQFISMSPYHNFLQRCTHNKSVLSATSQNVINI